MKKFLIAAGILACALFLQVSNALAYSNVNEGCTTCHVKATLHEVASHTACTSCHVDPAGARDVVPAKCAACHPIAYPGKCGLVKKHVKLMKNCASCHGTTLSVSGIGITIAGPACSSCHTDCTGACPAAKVLGEEDPRLEILRRFRNTVLAQSALGTKFIRMYYDNAESVNTALESHPKLKAFAHKVLESFIPVVKIFM